MMDYIKRLRLCIKWFQELEGSYLFEQEKLQNALDFAESRCAEMGIFAFLFPFLFFLFIGF
jgi:kinesin family protein C1